MIRFLNLTVNYCLYNRPEHCGNYSMAIQRKTDKAYYLKLKYILPVLVICVIAVVILLFFSSEKGKFVSPLRELGYHFFYYDEVLVPYNFAYTEGTAEYSYLQGIRLLEQDSYEAAKLRFEEAIEGLNEDSDPYLRFYLYNSYIVACQYIGHDASVDLGELVTSEIIANPDLGNDVYSYADSLASLSADESSTAAVKDMFLRIIDACPGLDQASLAVINNRIAMMDYIKYNYFESIKRFYDVKEMISELPPGERLREEEFSANSYLAIIFYEFEEYEDAIEFLEQNIAIPFDTPEKNANNKSTEYINLGWAYLDNNDPDNAVRTASEYEKIICYMDESIKEACWKDYYELLFRAELKRGDIEKAKVYLRKANEHAEHMAYENFYGSKETLEYSRCLLLRATGHYAEAASALEVLAQSENIAFAGIEEEIYNTLVDCYDKLGDNENYYRAQRVLIEIQRDLYTRINKEYFSFSKYYVISRRLEKENHNLMYRNIIFYVIIGLMFVVILTVTVLGILYRRASFIDNLTGINNRKLLNILEAKTRDKGLSVNTNVLMMDIDYFKRYNDTYGHMMGDEALKMVAGILKKNLRKKDFLIRYGGEEFLVVIDNITDDIARDIAERIRKGVIDSGIPHMSSSVSSVVTLSMGLCINRTENAALSDVIRAADELLYKAKENGRNRLEIGYYDNGM